MVGRPNCRRVSTQPAALGGYHAGFLLGQHRKVCFVCTHVGSLNVYVRAWSCACGCVRARCVTQCVIAYGVTRLAPGSGYSKRLVVGWYRQASPLPDTDYLASANVPFVRLTTEVPPGQRTIFCEVPLWCVAACAHCTHRPLPWMDGRRAHTARAV